MGCAEARAESPGANRSVGDIGELSTPTVLKSGALRGTNLGRVDMGNCPHPPVLKSGTD